MQDESLEACLGGVRFRLRILAVAACRGLGLSFRLLGCRDGLEAQSFLAFFVIDLDQ